MAHSTYRTTVDRICLEAGVLPSDTNDQFNDNTQLSAPTLKAKLFTDTCNRLLIRRMNKLFTARLFTLTTLADQEDYEVDPVTNVEGISYHSVRCNTTGAARRLDNVPYVEYRDQYADLTTMPTGKPQQWVAIATASADGVERANKIRILPTPDDTYEIEYQAKINASPLTSADDIILWPVEYEDVLWHWARAMLEGKLGAGVGTEAYAEAALDSLKVWGTGPVEQRKAVRLGVQISGGRRGSGAIYDTPNYTRGW